MYACIIYNFTLKLSYLNIVCSTLEAHTCEYFPKQQY